MIFVDSGAWFARFVPEDPRHRSVVDWIRSTTQTLVTSDYVVDETLTLLLARRHAAVAVRAGDLLFDESVVHVHHVTPAQFASAWALFQQRADQGWSFTDCTSKVVIDELGIASALAFDRHFQAFGVSVLP